MDNVRGIVFESKRWWRCKGLKKKLLIFGVKGDNCAVWRDAVNAGLTYRNCLESGGIVVVTGKDYKIIF